MGRVVVGMIGLGTVGTGVVRLLSQQHQLVLKKIAVRNINKMRNAASTHVITENVSEVIDDPEIEVLVEVMGGEHPALEYIKRGLERRKHIVTANKEVLAKHGPDLFKIAKQKGVTIFFEAAVAGGIPLISTIHKGLEATKISSVTGILNGTTNFILSKMEGADEDYQTALSRAQALGFAEADPTSDVEGYDVAYKLSILSALSFGKFARPEEIYREGITKVSARDIAQAKQLGYRIKLIGITQKVGEQIDVRVHPMLVPLDHPLASVSGSKNGILVAGDAVDEIMLVGPGAGQMPTASAVVGDIINLASALRLPDFASYFQFEGAADWANLSNPDNFTCPYYLRILYKDAPGIIGQIGTILGDNHISINSIFQQGILGNHGELIIITESVNNGHMNRALTELRKCHFLKNVEGCIRIFKPHVSGNT